MRPRVFSFTRRNAHRERRLGFPVASRRPPVATTRSFLRPPLATSLTSPSPHTTPAPRSSQKSGGTPRRCRLTQRRRRRPRAGARSGSPRRGIWGITALMIYGDGGAPSLCSGPHSSASGRFPAARRRFSSARTRKCSERRPQPSASSGPALQGQRWPPLGGVWLDQGHLA